MNIQLKEITPNKKNPRFIRDEQFEKLKRSVAQFPAMLEKRGLAVRKQGKKWEAIGGNMRLRALTDLEKEIHYPNFVEMYSVSNDAVNTLWSYFNHGVPCVDCSDFTPAEVKRFVIADNVPFGEWDTETLANEWDAEDLGEWGLEFEFEQPKPEVFEDDYEIPDEIETDIVLGDLFEIGPHRLLCGDSTDAEQVKQLMNGGSPFLMITDPPYGVEYDANWRNESFRIGGRAVGKVNNDDCASWPLAYRLSPASVAYVWHDGRHAKTVQMDLEQVGFEMRSQIIWVKSNFAISRGHYHWKHEPCWYAFKRGVSSNWVGNHSQTTVWEIAKPSKSETGHSTQKPVECMYRPIANHSGDVHDPFLGSGTTMVAAHQLNRVCYGMELDPKYCQVIVDRMLKLDPSLEVKKNGQPYQNPVKTP